MRVVVIGGGPAGMNAARAASAAGAEVVLVDAEPTLGGQFHRGDPQRVDVRHLAQTSVWALEPGLRLHLLTGSADSPHRIQSVLDADRVVLASGAHDRVVPFPGWDLPGVYTAGAAQVLAKAHGVAVGRRVLVSGTGPFLLPVAESLIKVGAEVVSVLEANAVRGWLRRPRAMLAGMAKAGELTGYLALLARHRVPLRRRSAVIAAHGTDRVTSVTVAKLAADWTPVPGTERDIEVDAVAVGHGFTPRLELAVAAGCAIVDGFVEVDARQATSVPNVYAAGEITGIGGADLSAAEGTVAGAAAAGAPIPAAAARALRRGRVFAAGLAAAHPIRPGWHSWLTPETLICRCEEVDYQALCAATEHGSAGVRTFKLTSRCGLGMCQGRICGDNSTDLAKARLDQHFFDDAALARRPIATPIRLGELARTNRPEEDQ